MSSGKIKLYEALELRSYFNQKIEYLNNLLGKSSGWLGMDMRRNNDNGTQQTEPVESFDKQEIKNELDKTERKLQKLNNQIQIANFQNVIEYNGEELTIADALQRRKSIQKKLNNNTGEVVQSTYKTVVYMENREIEDEPDFDFSELDSEYRNYLKEFYQLNKKLREVQYEVDVNFFDEF